MGPAPRWSIFFYRIHSRLYYCPVHSGAVSCSVLWVWSGSALSSQLAAVNTIDSCTVTPSVQTLAPPTEFHHSGLAATIQTYFYIVLYNLSRRQSLPTDLFAPCRGFSPAGRARRTAPAAGRAGRPPGRAPSRPPRRLGGTWRPPSRRHSITGQPHSSWPG